MSRESCRMTKDRQVKLTLSPSLLPSVSSLHPAVDYIVNVRPIPPLPPSPSPRLLDPLTLTDCASFLQPFAIPSQNPDGEFASASALFPPPYSIADSVSACPTAAGL